MKAIKVKDLMVPLSGYARVSENASLHEAVTALEEAQKDFDSGSDRHRAILVFDANNRIVGKLSQWDLIRALEPKYEEIGDMRAISRFGWSPNFVKSMLDKYGLWEKPLDDICRKAASKMVKRFMTRPTEGEFVEEDATLDEAIHQFIMGHHLSLLVTRKGDIVGILRLCDVFREICGMIRACEL